MKPQACLLCGGCEAEVVFAYDAPDVYEMSVGVRQEGYARAWVRCVECGLYYSRYNREPDHLDRIYDRAYREAGRSFRTADADARFREVIALPPEQSESVQRAEAIAQTIKRLQDQAILDHWKEHPHRLLDVGGASGVFAYVFQAVVRDADWRVEIVDPSAQGRFVESYGVTYHQRRFDREFDAGRFHLVSMNYLLEHVSDPHAVLSAARKRLLDSGLLYVEVPDEIAFQRLPKDDDIFNSCHLWMFGPTTLLRLVETTGFVPLTVTRGRSPRGHFSLAILASQR